MKTYGEIIYTHFSLCLAALLMLTTLLLKVFSRRDTTQQQLYPNANESI